MIKPSIVFFGTGPVSLFSLEGIYDHFTIEAIFTKPDRVSPGGKSHTHPVKNWANLHHIPIFQVANTAELSQSIAAQQLDSRVGLVVDFGIIIEKDVIDAFELGIINSHFSLLPRLRGADPITFAILEGLDETGVSLMRIVPAMDRGKLLTQVKYPISPTITTPELTQELGELSNRLLVRDLPRYLGGEIDPTPQVGTPSYTRKLTKADGLIDWAKPAMQLEREVRAFIGWPGSNSPLFGREVTICNAIVVGSPCTDANTTPGSVTTHQNSIIVTCGEITHLEITHLKPSGKREMSAADFLRGLPSSR